MEIAGQKLNTLEEILYKKEEKEITDALRQIGKQLEELFRPYYLEERGVLNDTGKTFKDDFSKFITDSTFAGSYYCSGYYTSAEFRPMMPEQMKAAILKKICADFVETVGEVENVCSQLL